LKGGAADGYNGNMFPDCMTPPHPQYGFGWGEEGIPVKVEVPSPQEEGLY